MKILKISLVALAILALLYVTYIMFFNKKEEVIVVKDRYVRNPLTAKDSVKSVLATTTALPELEG